MKIFRRFRESVIPGKGLRKYLVYAIGEILLVSVGILIALAVNNRNIAYQKERDTIDLAEKVLKQIKLDTAEVRGVLKIWDKLEDTVVRKVLQETKPDAPIVDCQACPSFIFSVSLPRVDGALYSSLDKQQIVDSPAGNKLLEVYETLRGFDKANSTYQNLAIEATRNNLSYLHDNYAWFAPFIYRGRCDEDCDTYFKTSPDFRNRVAYIDFLLFNAYYADLEEFLDLVEKDIVALEAIIEDAQQ